MKINKLSITFRRLFLNCLCLLFLQSGFAQKIQPLRRPISPQQPMWLIHIDTWNLADPQKIIDMVPKDIRPYVVFNISLSINHNAKTGKWLQVEYGYETAKSWLRTCAENRVWAMIQPSSGGFSHFSDTDLRVYEEFYRDYPNFLGFNYAEQFWGFDDKWSVSFQTRLAHWVDLMKLSHKYGGYLCVSFTNAYYDADRNPVALMKRDPNFAAICRQYPQHFIMCEKFTMNSGFSDVESTSLGAYLSGFAGQYGIRADETGWYGAQRREKFPVAAGAAPVIEHIMLTGETVVDGPETIPRQVLQEIKPDTSQDGFIRRRWEFYPQFVNISEDIFRKILDGTIRILSRKEVIDRTKLVLINDVNKKGTSRDSTRTNYITPESLYTGLYKMDNDGTYLNNHSWFKKTGRYPAIPMVYQLADPLANSFRVKVNTSDYATRWPTTAAKVNEFNQLFPEEYTGDIYAGRSENRWVVYNPFKTGHIANGTIPFKFNTCDSVKLTLTKYSAGIMKEETGRLNFYLTNFDNADVSLKTDTIQIFGSSVKPTCVFKDREAHQPSVVSARWLNGIFSLYITHNGPLDLTVNCAGPAKSRLKYYRTVPLIVPKIAPEYYGPHQYEAENFDYHNIEKNITNGINSGTVNYTAQGFLKFGLDQRASIRKVIQVLTKGVYDVQIRYQAPNGTVNSVALLLNGKKIAMPQFKQTADGNWLVNKQRVTLGAGKNLITFAAQSANANDLLFDNIVIVKYH